jgi:hypothetical protein
MRTSHSKRWISWSAAAAAIMGSGASSVSAQQAGGGGPACTRFLPTVNVEFTSSGAANKGPGLAAVACSAVRLATTSPAAVTVHVHDGNATNGSTGARTCSILVRSFNGASQLFGSSQATTGTFTGATSFSSTIPTNVVGYVTVNCLLPEPGAADSRLFGFNIQ